MKYSVFLCSFLVCGFFSVPADAAQRAAKQAQPQEEYLAPELRASKQTVNKIVAVVNGEMITMFDLEMIATPDVMQAGIDPRHAANQAKVKEILRRSLDTMVSDLLVVQEALRLGVTASEEDINAELRTVVERSKLSEDDFFREVARQGMTKEKVRERMRNRILQQRLMSNMVGRKVLVTKDEIAEHFKQQGGVISTSPTAEVALLIYHPQAPAAQLAGYIRDGKAPFEEVVKRASIGPRREEGGRISGLKMDDMSPVLRTAIEKTKVGTVSSIFEMDGHKTQVKVFSIMPGEQFTTLESATPLIEERLRSPKIDERYKEYLAQLRKKARVEIRL